MHDENAIENPQTFHFDLSYWQGKPGYSKIEGGRGGSAKIEIDGQTILLRQYYRGGLVAKLFTDEYLWLGRNKTRAVKEWLILRQAREAGLPVPQALAVCVRRSGLIYRAAIMTEYFADTETLAAHLSHSRLSNEAWGRLGKLLNQLHSLLFRHADLNANNILIDSQLQFYLIDFDQAKIMRRIGDWQWSPLYRLQRSLDKIDRQKGLNFEPNNWQAMMDGYESIS